MAWISLEKAKTLEEIFGYPKVSEGKGVVSVEVPKDKFIEFLTFLKEDPEYQFKMFIDLTIIDHGEKENSRFQGVVILFSPKKSRKNNRQNMGRKRNTSNPYKPLERCKMG